MLTSAGSSLALVAIGVIVLICVAFLPTVSQDSAVGVGPLMRYAAVAAVAAVLAGLMYVAFEVKETLTSLGLGNTMSVMAPAMVWCGLRRVSARAGPAVVAAGAAGVTTLVATLIAPGPIASGIKVLLMAVMCALICLATRGERLRTTRGATPLAAVGILFAAYSVGRLGVALSAGEESELYQRLFSGESVAAANGLAMVGCAAGVLLLRRDLSPRGPALVTVAEVELLGSAVLEHGQPLTAYTGRLPELQLIRAAYGESDAWQMRDALATAIQISTPGYFLAGSRSGDHFVALAAASSDESACDRIREEYARRAPVIDGVDTTNPDIERVAIADLDALHRVLAPLRARTFPWQEVSGDAP